MRIKQSAKLTSPKTYSDLKSQIRSAIKRGKRRAEQAVEHEKVRTSWEIGKLILNHVLSHKRAGYGLQVKQRLSKDLGISRSQIDYMVEFAQAFPISPPAGKLNWSSYTDLLSINDPTKRKRLTEQAEKNKWTRAQLREELKKYKTPRSNWKKGGVLVEPKQGSLKSFAVVEPKAGPYQGMRVYDLGFSVFAKPRGRLREAKASYTYEASVLKVIDGDTFWAVIDLGFGITIEQKLRLSAVDTPEIASKAGERAKRFLARELKKTPLVIRTTKSDKYDRYLADVWAGGAYLNQLLLTKGHAVLAKK